MSVAALAPERLASPEAIPEAPRIEIVVPVYNEQAALPGSIRRLHDHLSAELPFSWRIVIADNASTDQTPRLARALAEDLPGVEFLHLTAKGRGRALRAAWSRSDARGRLLHGRGPVDGPARAAPARRAAALRPQRRGHRHAARRGARGSCAAPKRELISRGYNRVLRTVLRARFSDAQCGFKAVRARRAPAAARRRARRGLVLRHRAAGARPARGDAHPRGPGGLGRRPRLPGGTWSGTAVDDLRGVARLVASAPLARFLALGVASTVAYALLYRAAARAARPGRAPTRWPWRSPAVANSAGQPATDVRRARPAAAWQHHARWDRRLHRSRSA